MTMLPSDDASDDQRKKEAAKNSYLQRAVNLAKEEELKLTTKREMKARAHKGKLILFHEGQGTKGDDSSDSDSSDDESKDGDAPSKVTMATMPTK